MLTRTRPSNRRNYEHDAPQAVPDGGFIGLDRLIAAFRRSRLLIAGCILLGALAGAAYLVAAPKQYTATAGLLIDSRKGADLDPSASIAELQFDSGAIESQVEIIQSEEIANAVIDRLKLMDDPDFLPATRSPLSGLATAVRDLAVKAGLLSPDTAALEAEAYSRRKQTIDALLRNLTAKRVRLTYVIEVAYEGRSPELSARIAQAFAQAYIDKQLEARSSSSRRANEWLEGRLKELRRQVIESDTAVQNYRAANGLISSGNGQLVNDQQLTELNSQLVAARLATTKAQAVYDRIMSILQSGDADAAVSESIGNAVIVDLRGKLLAADKLRAEFVKTLGDKHMRTRQLDSEIAEYRRLILDELSRIAESYKSDLEIARSNQKTLEDNLSALVGISAGTNQSLVSLRELEREAESYKDLYQTLLQQYQTSVQRETLPTSEARIITPATPPLFPSSPKKPLILGLMIIAGAAIGIGLAGIREFRDGAFRSGQQVREEIGSDFLGYLPELAAGRGSWFRGGNADQEILDVSIREPFSSFGETLQAVKAAVDHSLHGGATKVIGIVSVLPGEGKTTVAKNLASMLSLKGSRTLLLDGDARNPALSRLMAAAGGAATEPDHPKALPPLMTEANTGLFIQPLPVKSGRSSMELLLSSARLAETLASVQQHYDYVVVDLPPLGPVSDVRALADCFDGFILVARWGETSRKLVSGILAREHPVADRLIGVLLNRTDLKAIKLYEDMGPADYYYGYYNAPAGKA